MAIRSRTRALATLPLRFPVTVLLLMLVGLDVLVATGTVAATQLLLFPVLLLFYVVDPLGALATRLGLPYPGAIELGAIVLVGVGIDWVLRRAAR